MRLHLFILLFAFLLNAQINYNPIADPKAVVQFGRARFTILTPTLVRMELSNGQTYDDRATIQVVNRKLDVPVFTVAHPNTSTVVITTSKLTITHISNYSPNACSNAQTNTDQVDGARVPDYPNGASAANQNACCALCNNDRSCTSWVYATGQSGTNCWLMMNVQGTTNANDRVYGTKQGFTADNLWINFNGMKWAPGMAIKNNLGGTISALDCYSTKEQCNQQYWAQMGPGLLTKDGWYILDDTSTARYDSPIQPAITMPTATIPWYNETTIDDVDLYFFGNGLDFTTTILDYSLIGGNPAIPPRTAFGVWWSRYFAYSEAQFISEVLQGYATNNLPLSHVVLDMDWHTEINLPGCDTWGGYTFNTNLFPNPQQFISSLHSNTNVLGHPVKLLLNVHPQSGVDHCQGNYPAFAKAMGVNPSTNQTIPCNFGNSEFGSNLYSIFLNAEPLTGVDFWWTDYGGCGGPSGRSQYWSNYYFDAQISINQKKRPLVLSRYGGLGNHRYPIGFSGDTFQSFLTLDFEVQMTPTAANVLFGYWSHDIGGFHSGTGSPGDGDPKNVTGSELLLRWMQFGAVAPIDRTHCDHCERRIWLFPHFEYMKQAFVLRNALVPYIYTNARYAFETGVALVHPMYYDNPNSQEAYNYKTQYMFGQSIIAAPITTVTNSQSNAVQKEVWLPSGVWVNWNGTKTYQGPTLVNDNYGVQDIPIFVKSGVVIPLQTAASVVSSFANPVMWTIFPGSNTGRGTIYEDDGNSLDYIDNRYATTNVAYTATSTTIMVTVSPTSGSFSEMPTSRSHMVQVRGYISNPSSVKVNGQTISQGTGTPGWYISNTYNLDITEGALVISTGSLPVNSQISVEITK